jgi:thiol-disulfide isomerase/thioredoxin
MGSRFGGTPQAKSIAVVGDRPVSVASGEPGGRVVAEADPEPKPNPKARISGRVVDEQGEPVANATVRLADGGAKGGKDIRGTTDRSGAFTLNGLRPGSTYSLVAEDEDGTLTGQVKAKTAATGVEISLLSDQAPAKAAALKTSRSARAKPISSRDESAEEPADEGRAVINREDVGRPGDSAEEIDPGPQSSAGRPQLVPPQAVTGWQNSKTSPKARSKTDDADAVATSNDDDTPRRSRKVTRPPTVDEDEEGPNPLPPALEPGQDDEPAPKKPTSTRLKPKTKSVPKPPVNHSESGEMSLAPDTTSIRKPNAQAAGPTEPAVAANEMPSLDSPGPALTTSDPGFLPDLAALAPSEPSPSTVPAATTGPPDMPPLGEIAAAAALASAPPNPPPANPAPIQEIPPTPPASQPVFASQEAAPPPKVKSAEYDPFALVAATPPTTIPVVDRPPVKPLEALTTATQLAEAPTSNPVAPKTKWGDLAARDVKPKANIEPTKATFASSIVKRFRPAPPENAEKVDTAVASCSYDAKQLRIKDFRLPDLDGKPVRFQDLGADFVLLDFWGTWCSPCLESIPHLVELQKQYGPNRLKVVGIACEEVEPSKRKAKVEEVARKLGINYPVLLSTMDGKPCPLQQAMAIQAMPTMILLDRSGQIKWRSTGSTPANESRLDRVLASQMSWSDTARH